MLWGKFEWILPLYIKSISFRKLKVSVAVQSPHLFCIDLYVKKLNVFPQHTCHKTNEYQNSAEQITWNWNVYLVSVLITPWDIT